MKFFTHFAVQGFSNSYLIGPDDGGDAVLIDPGTFDIKLLKLIENNNLYVKHILVTHAHSAHIKGIKTIKKIYDARIYSYRSNILGLPATEVREGNKLKLSPFNFKVIETPGHSTDSIVFLMDKFLFTGDTLTAGMIGSAMDGYSRGLLLTSIHKKLLILDNSIFIFPGHGPPSKIEIEKKLNPFLKEKL